MVAVGGGCISFCVQIMRDFEISNFFLSNLLTYLLTLTRPRGAFAPKNVSKQMMVKKNVGSNNTWSKKK